MVNVNPDLRHQRAQRFTAMVLNIVGKHIDDRRVLRGIAIELEDQCRKEGVEIITDATRADMGLPARGPFGLTPEEVIALEHRRLEAMRAPMFVQIPVVGVVK